MSIYWLLNSGVKGIPKISTEIYLGLQIVGILRKRGITLGLINDAAQNRFRSLATSIDHGTNLNDDGQIDPADRFGDYVKRNDLSKRRIDDDKLGPTKISGRRKNPSNAVALASAKRSNKASQQQTGEIARRTLSSAGVRVHESTEAQIVDFGNEQNRQLDFEDTFGLLDTKRFTRQAEYEELDEEEKKEEADEMRRLSTRRTNTRVNTMYWYGRRIKKLCDNKQLTEALAFFKRMVEVDGAKPDDYVYSNLIGGCGRAGYTKMAFQLHKQMKENGLNVPLAVYTGLFNSCGNSPFPEDALRYARQLLEEIETKTITLNSTNYNAAIKAFGRCNDLQAAFKLVDEMIAKKIGVTTATFNFLLIACASNKELGFLRAVQVWKNMREKRIKPDIYSFNLLIRAVRDCGLGDPKLAGQLLLNSGNKTHRQEHHRNQQQQHQRETTLEMLLNVEMKQDNGLETSAKHLNSGLNVDRDGIDSNSTTIVPSGKAALPDILSPRTNAGNVVSLNEASTAQDRLLMLGGCEGILRRMRMCKVEPELRTFTELIEICPPDDERRLVETMNEQSGKVTADVDIFNVLIKKRNCRGDWEGAKDVLVDIAQRHLNVDVATFGALALGCKRWDQAKQLLEDMKTSGLKPNSKILGVMIKQACHSKNFWYLIDMIKRLKVDGVQVDERMLQDIEKCIATTKKFIVKKERAGLKSTIIKQSESFRIFYMFYKQFLMANDVKLAEHPWKVYELKQADTENAKY